MANSDSKPSLRVGVSYDFETCQTRVSAISICTRKVEQVKWLDDIGADLVVYRAPFVDDGYLPSWAGGGCRQCY